MEKKQQQGKQKQKEGQTQRNTGKGMVKLPDPKNTQGPRYKLIHIYKHGHHNTEKPTHKMRCRHSQGSAGQHPSI